MIIDIDIGNTRAKYRVTAAANTVTKACAHGDLLPALQKLPLQDVTAVRIASVAARDVAEALADGIRLRTSAPVVDVVSTMRYAGVTNSYAEPQRLGVDRWLAMIATYNRWQAPCIVIDAGSALTLDVVDAAGFHQGGWIVPGLGMLRTALIAGTAAVRFDMNSPQSLALGCSTAEAVHNGTLSMVVAWLEESVSRLLERHAGAHIALCGGDAAALRSYLSFDALDWPDIVLDGLALISVGD